MPSTKAATETQQADVESGVDKPSRDTPVIPKAFKKGVGLVVGLGGVLSALGGIINDILIPNGPVISLAVAGASLAGVGVTLLRGELAKSVPDFAQKYVTGYWRRPVRIAFSLSVLLSLLAVRIIDTAPAGGAIGAKLPAVHEWQVQLGIVAANTARIAEDVAVIKDELKDVKQETSTDPRKELANLGVPWTAQAFVEALKLSDERTVRLFLDGGVSPTADYKGAAAVVWILQPGLTVSPVPMLTLLVEKGFDLDTILTDDYIMSNTDDDPYSIFPPQFENQDPYLYVGKGHFQGPALLWVVIEATWYIPTAHDLETLHFLVDHGADRTIAMNYMNFIAPDNDTQPYFTVLEILKS